MDKSARYKWSDPGKIGKRELIDVSTLRIDYKYQRDEVSNRSTIKMASEFSLDKCGELKCARREDGSIWVVDGQQRLLAALHRGDIKLLPCSVVESKGVEHEAELFVAYNTKRKNVSSWHKYKACVTAGVSPQKEIDAWVRASGWHVTTDGKDTRGIDFPHILVKTWVNGTEAAKSALIAQRECIGPAVPMDSKIHLGMFWLYRRGVDVIAHSSKIRSSGGRDEMMRSINQTAIEMSLSRNERTCGVGILRVINFRRRHKTTVKGEE